MKVSKTLTAGAMIFFNISNIFSLCSCSRCRSLTTVTFDKKIHLILHEQERTMFFIPVSAIFSAAKVRFL